MKFDLAVTVREKSGKGAARQLRRSGKVPGVLYGQGECLLLTIEPEAVSGLEIGHFEPRSLVGVPEAVISVAMGEATNVEDFAVQHEMVQPTTQRILDRLKQFKA